MADSTHARPESPEGSAAEAVGLPPVAEQLRADFHAQTARIAFSELQRPFAAGRLVLVDPRLDLVEVAVQLALDDSAQFQSWIETSQVAAVSDAKAAAWVEENAVLWAVVAQPWVLVQQRDSAVLTESP